MERVQLNGADIEYDVRGSGEPVVFFQKIQLPLRKLLCEQGIINGMLRSCLPFPIGNGDAWSFVFSVKRSVTLHGNSIECWEFNPQCPNNI